MAAQAGALAHRMDGKAGEVVSPLGAFQLVPPHIAGWILFVAATCCAFFWPYFR